MVAAAVFIWVETRDHTLFLDEWGFLVRRDGFTVDGLLEPEYGHLLLFPLILYRGAWDLFGIGTDVPLRLALIFFDLLASILLFVWLERRVGSWIAAGAASLVCVLGSGWEVVATTDGVAALISISAGLGMMLMLDRGDRRGDVWAGVLLAVSLASFGTGVPFIVAAVILVNCDSPWRRRRNWAWAIPVVAYLAWRAWASAEFEDSSFFNWQNLPNVPSLLVDSLGGSLAAITGLFRTPGQIGGNVFRLDIGEPMAIGLLAFCAYWFVKGFRVERRAWAVIATYFAFWVAVAMVLGPARPDLATAPRYFYPGVVLLLMAGAAVVARPPRLSSRAWVVLGIVLVSALVANLFQYHYSARYVGQLSALVRADLTALDLGRGRIPDSFEPDGPAIRDAYGQAGITILTAGSYYAHEDEFGTPSYSVAELTGEGETVRKRADVVLASGLALALESVPALPPAAAKPPPVLVNTGVESIASGGCLGLRPGRPGSHLAIGVPASGLGFEAPAGAAPGTPAASVNLGRFAEGIYAAAGSVSAGSAATLSIPPDDANVPWKALVAPSAPLRVCALA